MSQIFTASMASDFSEWTSETDTSDYLDWSAGAGLAGTSGGAALEVANTTARYLVKTVSTNTSGKMRCRYYIDINSLTMGNGDQFTGPLWRSSAGNTICSMDIAFTTAGGYYMKAAINNDAGGSSSTAFPAFTDAPHYIEIYLQRASGTSSNDGSVQFWIDGTSAGTATGIDNYDRFNDFATLRFGITFGLDAGTSGTIYLDEVVINDDGSEIGPVAAPAAGNPYYAYLQQ